MRISDYGHIRSQQSVYDRRPTYHAALSLREDPLSVYIRIHSAHIPPYYDGASHATGNEMRILLTAVGHTYSGAALSPEYITIHVNSLSIYVGIEIASVPPGYDNSIDTIADHIGIILTIRLRADRQAIFRPLYLS